MARVTSAISCFRSFSASSSFGACAFISIAPFAALLRRRGLARSIQGQSEQSLKTLRREPFSQRIIPSGMEQRSSDPLSLLSARLRAVAVQRFAIPSVAVFCSCGGAHHLFGWDAVYLLGVDAHEVLPAAGDDIGFVFVVTQVAQEFKHRLISELRIGTIPARMLGRFQPLLANINFYEINTPQAVRGVASQSRRHCTEIQASLDG
jgi:hypothetical protein